MGPPYMGSHRVRHVGSDLAAAAAAAFALIASLSVHKKNLQWLPTVYQLESRHLNPLSFKATHVDI